ncbi:MAG: hypothetical protein AB1664_22435, partial [Thermodesulfobacteriota bacterium]
EGGVNPSKALDLSSIRDFPHSTGSAVWDATTVAGASSGKKWCSKLPWRFTTSFEHPTRWPL